MTMTGEPCTIRAGKDDIGQVGSITVEARSTVEPDFNSDGKPTKSPWNRRVALIGGLIVLIAAAVVIPPLINIGRYQRSITALMTLAMGRPVYMSSVELRLLPRPGFVLHDLSVSEDPGFGAEPILSARTVIASIRILSLWRGRLEIDRVSVDDASLNLVRSAEGRWNLDSLLMGARPALTGEDAAASPPKGMLAARSSAHFPYLEATDSRVNLKNGVEKSPFSLVSTDLSLWQDEPGAWRVRLRGQPVRTDMEMSLADTGEVRMEASLHSGAQLREMPLKLQMEWREAQLGQLSRLLLGSDAGWRGGVTADIDVQGTPENAQTKARLRATGVRREEFAPETPLDFDANCGFRYQHSQNAVDDVDCTTAIGGGRLHLKGELPGNGGKPEAMLEVNQLPLQAGLDLLRTLRNGFAPGISAKGTANGSLTYKETVAEDPGPKKSLRRTAAHKTAGAAGAVLSSNLHGTLTVDGGQLKGGGLKEPLTLPKITLAPALLSDSSRTPGGSAASLTGLGARFTVVLAPATAPASPSATGQPAAVAADAPAAIPAQAVTVRLGLDARGYDAAATGSAGIARIRDLAYAFGLPHLDAADGFAGGTADLNFTAAGPWIASGDSVAISQSAPASSPSRSSSKSAASVSEAATEPGYSPGGDSSGHDSISGSVQLHHAQWKAAYLTRPAELAQATITVSATRIALVGDFTYGGVKGTGKDLGKDAGGDAGKDMGEDTPKDATKANAAHVAEPLRGSVVVNASPTCKPASAGNTPSLPGSKGSGCDPQVELRFGALDAAAVQAALVGAPEEKGLFSPLMDRMRSTDRPKWPEVVVHAQAESLVLGSITLQKPVIQIKLKGSDVVLENWAADLLGGSAKGTGLFAWSDGKPEYSLDGSFTGFNAAATGSLVNAEWAGGPVSGSGHLNLSGLTGKELTSSAAGDLRFDWPHGVLETAASPEARGEEMKGQEMKSPEPKSPETKFDEWSGTVAIEGGNAQIGQNELRLGKRTTTVAGGIPFGGPAKLTIAPSETKLAAARLGQARKPVSPPAVK
jgi:hypothetical protein